MTRGKRVQRFVDLSGYEARLLEKYLDDMKTEARKRKEKEPTLQQAIAGCIRTAIHQLYGNDYLYTEMLDDETFKRLMSEAGLPPTEGEQ